MAERGTLEAIGWPRHDLNVMDGTARTREARVSVQMLAGHRNADFHILTLNVEVAVTVLDTEGILSQT
jgi:hypothetical protein